MFAFEKNAVETKITATKNEKKKARKTTCWEHQRVTQQTPAPAVYRSGQVRPGNGFRLFALEGTLHVDALRPW